MKTLVILSLLVLLNGCSVFEPIPRGSEPSPTHMRLLAVLRDYRLPSHSLPPTRNADPQVEAAIRSMQTKAEEQGLVFDGSRASEGTVIAGRMGSTDQMLVAVAVYSVSGRVAIQDVHQWKASDMSEGARMRERYLSSLR